MLKDICGALRAIGFEKCPANNWLYFGKFFIRPLLGKGFRDLVHKAKNLRGIKLPNRTRCPAKNKPACDRRLPHQCPGLRPAPPIASSVSGLGTRDFRPFRSGLSAKDHQKTITNHQRFFDGRAQTQSQRHLKPSNPKDHQIRLSLWAF